MNCEREHAGPAAICAACEECAPLRFYTEYARRYAARDLDAFIELFSEDWTMTDHRVGGAERPIGRATCRAWTAAVFAVSPDVRFKLDEVLACDEHVIAMRASYRGSGYGPGGSGAFAFVGGFVTVVKDAHSLRVDQYEYDDGEAMLARYAALSGG